MRTLGAFRKGKGFSQEEFGKKLGLSQATYQSYESGRTSIPEDIQGKIRKMGYIGPWPQEEVKDAPPAAQVSEREIGKLEGRIEALERVVERLAEAFRHHMTKEPDEAHPQARS